MEGFVKISKYAGMREDLVQAGGGNSSYKISKEKMVIKASGYQLSDMTINEGYALVNPSIIKAAFLNVDDIDAITEVDSRAILEKAFIEGKRPSIETFLHAISDTYTLHTHPIVVNALTCREGGMNVLKQLFPQALIVSYATPGVELARAYFKAYKEYGAEKKPNIIFLQNHGLVVSGESAEEVIEKTEMVTRKIEGFLSCDFSEYHELTVLWKYFPEKIVWKITDINIIRIYRYFEGIWQHTFCPDCIVFLGKKMLELPDNFSEKEICEFCEEFGQPVMINHQGNLYIVADTVKKALEIQSVMSFSAQVMYLNKNERCELLTDKEQNFLLNWDAEKYRKAIK